MLKRGKKMQNLNAESLKNLSEKVIQIVRQVADAIKSVAFDVTEKTQATNIVTTSDILSQHLLIEKLGALIPDSGFYCEEESVNSSHKKHVWVIDPIDGTANYSRGINDCAISVALVEDQKVVLGVVCSIFTGDVYSATLGGGAFFNGKPIKVSNNTFERSILCTALCLYKKEHAKLCGDIIYEAFMQCNDVRRFGSCALEFCYLAHGRCDIYFEIRVFPWDYAGAYLILKEAGGVIIEREDGKFGLDGPTVVVAANNAENYDRLYAIVDKHLKNNGYKG